MWRRQRAVRQSMPTPPPARRVTRGRGCPAGQSAGLAYTCGRYVRYRGLAPRRVAASQQFAPPGRPLSRPCRRWSAGAGRPAPSAPSCCIRPVESPGMLRPAERTGSATAGAIWSLRKRRVGVRAVLEQAASRPPGPQRSRHSPNRAPPCGRSPAASRAAATPCVGLPRRRNRSGPVMMPDPRAAPVPSRCSFLVSPPPSVVRPVPRWPSLPSFLFLCVTYLSPLPLPPPVFSSASIASPFRSSVHPAGVRHHLVFIAAPCSYRPGVRTGTPRLPLPSASSAPSMTGF